MPDTGRAARLVIELSSGTAIVDGEEVELPLREFRLLGELAQRVAEPVPAAELIEAVWPDEPWTPKENLYILVTRLRRRIDGATKFGDKIRNRRGFGYVLDLEGDDVVVADSRDHRTAAVPAVPVKPEAITRDENPQPPSEEHQPADEGVADKTFPPAASRKAVNLLRVSAAAMFVLALVGTSWAAGYVTSRARQTAPPDHTAGAPIQHDATAQTDPSPAKGQRQRGQVSKKEKGTRKPRRKAHKGTTPAGSASIALAQPAVPPANGSQAAAQPPQQVPNKAAAVPPKDAPREQLPPPPTRYLYHLVHPDTGDHFVTTDGTTASRYEGSGYRGGAIAGIYTAPPEGVSTKPIATNHGTGYIFATSSPKTEPASRPVPLYYSSNGKGDFFYTTSAAEADQTGWNGHVVGYVRAL